MPTQFTVRNALNCSADDFWTKVHGSEAFYHQLYTELDFDYEIIERDDARHYRKAAIKPNLAAPASIKKVLGDNFGIVEVGIFHPDERRYTFDIQPSTLRDKITIRGEMRVEPTGPDSCDRVTDFDVRVEIFGVGRMIESFVEKSTKASYEKSARATNAFIATLA